MGTTSDAQKRAVAKYRKSNTKQIALEINLNTEQDILDRLNAAPAKMTYIKELIRADILANPNRFTN